MELYLTYLPTHQVNPHKITPGQKSLSEAVQISSNHAPQYSLQERHLRVSKFQGLTSSSSTHVRVTPPVYGTIYKTITTLLQDHRKKQD